MRVKSLILRSNYSAFFRIAISFSYHNLPLIKTLIKIHLSNPIIFVQLSGVNRYEEPRQYWYLNIS